MITIKDLPPHALQMARFALADALARDGDGVPEAIVACLNAWPGAYTEDERMYGKVIGKTIFLPLPEQEPSNER